VANDSHLSGSTLTERKPRAHGGRQHGRARLEPTRAYLKRRWESEVNDRQSMRYDQLENLEPFMIYGQSLVARHVAGEEIKDVWSLDGGRVAVFRSSTQIVRGVYAAAVRYDCDGAWRWRPQKGVKATIIKHQKRVHRCIEYAGRLGLMEVRAHQRNDAGEGLGILMIFTPAGVAQSVQATSCRWRSRGASARANRRCYPAQSRVNLAGRVSYPLRESPSPRDSKSPGDSTDVARRQLVARASRRKTSSDARRRQIQGRLPAPRSKPAAAHGSEGVAGPAAADPRRAMVARAVAGWSAPEPLVPQLGDGEVHGEAWWKAQGLA
jgi:hypothetical protein